jgi:hypothetical protein
MLTSYSPTLFEDLWHLIEPYFIPLVLIILTLMAIILIYLFKKYIKAYITQNNLLPLNKTTMMEVSN